MSVGRKFCTLCGAPSERELQYCTSCGARFVSGPPAAPLLPSVNLKRIQPGPPETLAALIRITGGSMVKNIGSMAREMIKGMIIGFLIVLFLNTLLQVSRLGQNGIAQPVIAASGLSSSPDALLFWFLFTAILSFFFSQLVGRGMQGTIARCAGLPGWIRQAFRSTGFSAFPLLMAGIATALTVRLFLLTPVTSIQFLILMFGILYSQQESFAILAMRLGYSDIRRIAHRRGPEIPPPGFPVMGVCGALVGFLITVFVAGSLLVIAVVVFLMVAGSVAVLYRNRRTASRILAATLVCALLLGVMAAAADCPPSCSCMTKDEARIQGYDPCNGKLTMCGYDPHQTAKYCYAVPPSTPPSGTATGKPPIPYGWYTYHTTGQVPTDEGRTVTVDSTLRYDITRETYRGQAATRIRMDMRTTASTLGSARVSVDMYQDPVTLAVLGGTATATQGGKTQSVDLSRIPELTSSGSGVRYTEPGDLSTKDFESSLKSTAAQSGGRFSKATEPLTIPAGTFPVTTRYTLTVPDEEGTATMHIWTSDSVPVILKIQGKDPAGREIMKMELTGYGVSGAAMPGGILGGILPAGSQGGPDTGDDAEGAEDIPVLISGSIGSGFGALGDGFNSISPLPVNWGEVPAVAAAGVTPAALGAFGVLVGAAFGTLSLYPGSIIWPESGGGRDWDGEIPDYSSLQDSAGGVTDEALTPLEHAAAGNGSDLPVDQLAAPPLPEETAGAGETEIADTGETPAQETTHLTEPGPDAEAPESDADAEPDAAPESLEAQVERLEQIQDLRTRVDQIIIDKTGEGYFIRNPHFPVKVWRWTVGGIYNWFAGNTGGQCGEAAGWGRDWITKDVKQIFGNDSLIEELVINPNSVSNHAATQVVLPDGDRYIVDMWAGLHEGSSRVYTEAEWLERWKKTIGGNPPVLRNNYEIQLEDTIRRAGNVQEGIDLFLSDYKNSEAAKITVRSFTKEPWFRP